ncbi:hypothetical protein L9F63_027334, partial [Diploptera punctata]
LLKATKPTLHILTKHAINDIKYRINKTFVDSFSTIMSSDLGANGLQEAIAGAGLINPLYRLDNFNPHSQVLYDTAERLPSHSSTVAASHEPYLRHGISSQIIHKRGRLMFR